MNYQIQTLNAISPAIYTQLGEHYHVSDSAGQPDAILVRSASMHDMPLAPSVLSIARAGAGTNNIPIDACTQAGVCVFNTPGANANAVCEMVLAAMLLSCRDIVGGVEWARGLKGQGDGIEKAVEKGKKAFVGPELRGKTLGVIGLGAIGVLVANAAAALGMKIVGYDPFLSVTHALNLTPGVEVVDTLPELYAKADYISLHLPMNDATRGTLNEASFAAMKDGVRIVNLARGELVDTPALKAALDSGKCAAYVTDFPNSETAAMEGVVAIPHLGASTPESEDNCAMMAAREVKEYLDNGSIINSVNLPNLTMAWAAKTRVCVISKGADAAAIAGAVPAVASASNTRGEYAYTILDTDAAVDEAAIAAIPGVLRVRVLTR